VKLAILTTLVISNLILDCVIWHTRDSKPKAFLLNPGFGFGKPQNPGFGSGSGKWRLYTSTRKLCYSKDDRAMRAI